MKFGIYLPLGPYKLAKKDFQKMKPGALWRREGGMRVATKLKVKYFKSFGRGAAGRGAGELQEASVKFLAYSQP